jgi:hypothetical protein
MAATLLRPAGRGRICIKVATKRIVPGNGLEAALRTRASAVQTTPHQSVR